MNYAQYISLALTLAQSVMNNIKGTSLEATIAADLQAAIASLEKVQGSPVTYAQLEGLRVQKTF